jgi:carboxyl-terminal processing protease
MSFWAALVVTSLLTGCSSVEETAYIPAETESEEMLWTGLADIQEIYIDKPNLSDLAVASLEGLRKIEPDIRLEVTDGVLKLHLSDGVAGMAKAPVEDNPYAWALTLSHLLQSGQRTSTRLRRAGPERIFSAMFDNLARRLDPYSRYSSAEEAQDNRASRDGFGGIGVTLVPHADGAVISAISTGLPAEKAGLRRGDRIVIIDGQPLTNFSIKRIVRLLQGPVGRSVQVSVRREPTKKPIEVSILRAHITPETVEFVRDGNIAVMKISHFNADTSSSLAVAVATAKHEMGEELRGIILDLRDNPGGLLYQSVRVADLFIDEGRIISTRGRHRDSVQLFDASAGDIAEGLPIAVLINGGTASAAEILAAALQDNDRAIVVGSRSYGKGSVQTVLRMPNNGELILTWARLHAPSGYKLSGVGIIPTLCTVGMADASAVLHQAFAENGAFWRRLIKLRREFDTADTVKQQSIKNYCVDSQDAHHTLDIAVAKKLLTGQKRYVSTFQTARTANEL